MKLKDVLLKKLEAVNVDDVLFYTAIGCMVVGAAIMMRKIPVTVVEEDPAERLIRQLFSTPTKKYVLKLTPEGLVLGQDSWL